MKADTVLLSLLLAPLASCAPVLQSLGGRTGGGSFSGTARAGDVVPQASLGGSAQPPRLGADATKVSSIATASEELRKIESSASRILESAIPSLRKAAHETYLVIFDSKAKLGGSSSSSRKGGNDRPHAGSVSAVELKVESKVVSGSRTEVRIGGVRHQVQRIVPCHYAKLARERNDIIAVGLILAFIMAVILVETWGMFFCRARRVFSKRRAGAIRLGEDEAKAVTGPVSIRADDVEVLASEKA